MRLAFGHRLVQTDGALWVGLREPLRWFWRVALEKKNRLVCGLRQRTGKHKFSSHVGVPGEAKMIGAELFSALQVVRLEVVDEQVVHCAIVDDATELICS